MTANNELTTLNNEHELIKSTRALILSYTGLFIVLVCGVFFMFYGAGKSLVNIFDAYDQGYFWTVELKKNLESMLAGNGFPDWSWSKGPGMEVKPVTDPFMIIAAMFPFGQTELGYSIATMLRLYCSGLAFLAFGCEVKMSKWQILMGSICYVFSAWIINVSLVQAQFVNITILFPILILSIDRVYKYKSPALFMITVAAVMCNSVYLAYMAGLSAVMYIIFRYFAYCDKFSLVKYLGWIGKFIVFGIIGIAASVAVTLVTVQSLLGASTGSSQVTYDTLQNRDFLMDLGNRFLSIGYHFGYGHIGIPVAAFMVVLVAYRYFSFRKTQLIMTAIFIVMMLFPFFSSMFNGFGYVTTRWYFMLVFFLVWTCADALDLDRLAKIPNLLIMLVTLVGITFTTLGFAYLDYTKDYSPRCFWFVAGSIATGVLVFLIYVLGIKGLTPLKFRQGAVLLVTVVSIIGLWNASFYDHMDDFVKLGEINSKLEKSTQRAGAQIDDDGFYRVDQVDFINFVHEAEQPANENLWWGTKTLYLYDSKVPSRLSEFNKIMANNYGYSKRVYIQSNGNRMGLDFLWGVKYFLGEDTKYDKTQYESSDGYAGYGFKYYDNIDGVNVFKNKYDSGLGFAYDKVISESELQKLPRLAREQAILQAMVVPDDTIKDIDKDQVIKAPDIEVSIKNVPYTFTKEDGVKVDGNTVTVAKVEEDAPNPGFSIKMDHISDAQMIVSFNGLHRYNKDGKLVDDFCVKGANQKLKAAANNEKNNQTIAGIENYDLNMGYYDSYNGSVKLKFNEPGIYKFDSLTVSAMSVSNYDKYAAKRLESKFKVTSYDDKNITGKADVKKDGFMFFSIPNNKNWEVFIDGKHADKIKNANISFMAVKITKGEHEITLQHNVKYKYYAYAVSLMALLLIVVLGLFCKDIVAGKHSRVFIRKGRHSKERS